MSLVESLYEPHVSAARAAAEKHQSVDLLLSPALDKRKLERFLIEYCSRGVHVTEPVESWIRRAGTRCKSVGLPEVGDALIRHAEHEANHHEMFISDTRQLVTRWNEAGEQELDADALVARPLTDGMRKYVDLHESVIQSDSPFAQVAIELEIERLSTTVLPKLLARFEQVLGAEVLAQLSFLNEHAALDVGHTHLNTRIMEQLLKQRPDAAATLGAVGSAALEAYLEFFGECLAAVDAELGSIAA